MLAVFWTVKECCVWCYAKCSTLAVMAASWGTLTETSHGRGRACALIPVPWLHKCDRACDRMQAGDAANKVKDKLQKATVFSPASLQVNVSEQLNKASITVPTSAGNFCILYVESRCSVETSLQRPTLCRL